MPTAMERAMERARMIVQQGQETAAKTREETAAKIANFKPLGALSGSRYHESTERGGKRRRSRRRRKSRKKRRKSRKKRRKSRRKRRRSRRRRRR